MNQGRLIGITLIVVGITVGVLSAVFLFSGVNEEGLSSAGAILGFGIVFLVLVAPLVGFGLLMVFKGGQEAAQHARAQQQRRLLDIVRSRGQVSINELALEMQTDRDTIRDTVHQLVGLQVFSGYVNWDKGELYSAEAQQLRELQKCENCGGEIKLSGKGIVTCRFCGTEYFLS